MTEKKHTKTFLLSPLTYLYPQKEKKFLMKNVGGKHDF